MSTGRYMSKPSFQERFRYFFDNTMSKGVAALIGWLALAMCVLIVVTSAVVWIAGIATASSFVEQTWVFLLRVLGGTKELPWSFRLATLVIVLGGIFVMSSLVSLLTTGFRKKLDELRKGRSKVIENNHTVILGWSESIFTIISELLIANENQQNPRIAVLADKDKVEMEDQIREKVGNTGRTRIICRTGSPTSMMDLDIVNLNASKSIIVVCDEKDSSATALKTILAIVNRPNRRTEPYHIVVNLHKLGDLEVAKIIGKEEVELIHVSSLIARIEAQSCRQSGLALVYEELLDFQGDEIYFCLEKEVVGKTYGDAVLSYENSAVIGIFSNGIIQINPASESVIQEGDEIIAISEDDNTVQISGRMNLGIDKEAITTERVEESVPVKLVVLGWNSHGSLVISDLATYLTMGSTITLVVDSSIEIAGIKQQFEKEISLNISIQQGDLTSRDVLDDLSLETVDHVVVLSCSNEYSLQEADSRTLVTLVHLRDIRHLINHPFTIVSEILDVRNREILGANEADDFILSDRLVSLAMAQISENKHLGPLFHEMFQPAGSEIYFRPVTNYVTVDRPMNFFTVATAALERNETAIGYRQLSYADNAERNYGLVINPKKTDYVDYVKTDQIIVFAED